MDDRHKDKVLGISNAYAQKPEAAECRPAAAAGHGTCGDSQRKQICFKALMTSCTVELAFVNEKSKADHRWVSWTVECSVHREAGLRPVIGSHILINM